MTKDLTKIGLIFSAIVILGTGLNINHQKNKQIESLQLELREKYKESIALKKLVIEYDNKLNTCYSMVGSLNSELDEFEELYRIKSDLEKFQATTRK